MPHKVISALLSLIGAVVGAALGLLIFRWLYQQSLYGMIVPGAALGLGSYLASRERSNLRGIAVAIVALALGIGIEAHYFPFVADESLSYFLTHIQTVIPAHLLMIALGGVFGFWWGREKSPWLRGLQKPVQVKDAVKLD